jgi:hypothetical protein
LIVASEAAPAPQTGKPDDGAGGARGEPPTAPATPAPRTGNGTGDPRGRRARAGGFRHAHAHAAALSGASV